MDDMTDDVSQEDTAEEQTAVSEEDHPRFKQLRSENHQLRQKLRRTELESEFGKRIVELIPEELPLSKWEEYAGKLAAVMPKATPESETTAPPEEASQEDEPAGLANVVKGPAPGTQASPTEPLTAKQIAELGKTNPVAAQQAMQAKYRAP